MLPTRLPSPPVAAWQLNGNTIVITINVGDTVTFTDLSSNVPTSWLWSFGSGEGTSTSQNPTHVYNNAGSFDVSLRATNAGGSDTLLRTTIVNVNAV